jgi:hypothetical protein
MVQSLGHGHLGIGRAGRGAEPELQCPEISFVLGGLMCLPRTSDLHQQNIMSLQINTLAAAKAPTPELPARAITAVAFARRSAE